jgi:hypothetical protein
VRRWIGLFSIEIGMPDHPAIQIENALPPKAAGRLMVIGAVIFYRLL